MVVINRAAKRPGFVALCTDPEEELVDSLLSLAIFSDKQYSHGLIGSRKLGTFLSYALF